MPEHLPILLPSPDQPEVSWGKLYGSSLGLALAKACEGNGFCVYLAADAVDAERRANEVSYFAPDIRIMQLPDWETLPYDVFSPDQEVVSQRLLSLYELPELTSGLLILNVASLMQRYPERQFVQAGCLVLETGSVHAIDGLRSQLQQAGYVSAPQVGEHGEFAVRGSLLDIFPMGSTTPFRIDFFDDEIETIRTFDPDSQRSLEKVASIRMLPAREFPFDDKAIRGFRQRYRGRFEGDPTPVQGLQRRD